MQFKQPRAAPSVFKFVHRSEHARHVPTCPFINTVKDPYTITVGDVLQLEKSAAELFIVRNDHVFKAHIYFYNNHFF